jgi:hypothetical protein
MNKLNTVVRRKKVWKSHEAELARLLNEAASQKTYEGN